MSTTEQKTLPNKEVRVCERVRTIADVIANADELIESLNLLKSESGVEHPSVGICGNLDDDINGENVPLVLNCYSFVTGWSEGWKHHTGGLAYMVPDNSEYGNWQGPNLEMRISLIDYLIDRVESVKVG